MFFVRWRETIWKDDTCWTLFDPSEGQPKLDIFETTAWRMISWEDLYNPKISLKSEGVGIYFRMSYRCETGRQIVFYHCCSQYICPVLVILSLQWLDFIFICKDWYLDYRWKGSFNSVWQDNWNTKQTFRWEIQDLFAQSPFRNKSNHFKFPWDLGT